MRLFLSLWLLLWLSSCGEAPQVHLALHVINRSDVDVSMIEFEVLDVHMQPAGFELTPDHEVTSEWVTLLGTGKSLRVVPGKATWVATGTVPVGIYERLYMRIKNMHIMRPNGTLVQSRHIVEPIAVSLDTSAPNFTQMQLDLILLNDVADASSDIVVFSQRVIRR